MIKTFGYYLLLSAAVISFAGCSLILGYDNPADPKSSSHQGYPVFDDPALFRAEYPSADTGALYFLDHFACAQILGADSYRLQLDDAEDFGDPLVEAESNEIPLFDGVDSPLAGDGTVYIRYALYCDDAWSGWTEPVAVNLVAPVMKEPIGIIYNSSPRVRWTEIPGAAAYELSLGSETVRVAEDEYQLTETLAFGTVLRLSVRGISEDGLYGPWSSMVESEIRVDVVGRWDLRYDWDSNGTWGSAVIRFYSDGTFMTSDDDNKDYGSYSASGNTIDWYYESGCHYSGTFEDEDTMSGTMLSSSGDRDGRWEAERKTLF